MLALKHILPELGMHFSSLYGNIFRIIRNASRSCMLTPSRSMMMRITFQPSAAAFAAMDFVSNTDTTT